MASMHHVWIGTRRRLGREPGSARGRGLSVPSSSWLDPVAPPSDLASSGVESGRKCSTVSPDPSPRSPWVSDLIGTPATSLLPIQNVPPGASVNFPFTVSPAMTHREVGQESVIGWEAPCSPPFVRTEIPTRTKGHPVKHRRVSSARRREQELSVASPEDGRRRGHGVIHPKSRTRPTRHLDSMIFIRSRSVVYIAHANRSGMPTLPPFEKDEKNQKLQMS